MINPPGTGSDSHQAPPVLPTVGADAHIGPPASVCKAVCRPHRPKPLLEERWHAQRDGEVCRPSGGGASAPFAHAETLQQAFGAVTPLSQPIGCQLPSRGAFPLRHPAPSRTPMRFQAPGGCGGLDRAGCGHPALREIGRICGGRRCVQHGVICRRMRRALRTGSSRYRPWCWGRSCT